MVYIMYIKRKEEGKKIEEEERKRSPMDLIRRPRIGAANDVNKYC
jgi:hypothetical protein